MNKRWSVIIVIILLAALAVYFGYSGAEKPQPEDAHKSEDDKSQEKEKLQAMTVLILGLDARDGGIGRTDTIMLVGYQPDNEYLNLLSIPRDTRVKIKGAYGKVNAAYVYGGPELAVQTVNDFLEIEIDHYAVVDFQGFEHLVDLVGGIEVDVPVRMYYPAEGINLQPGRQVLNGHDALAYSRYRGTGGGDLDRAERQQQVLALLTQKIMQVRNILKLPSILDVLEENVITDLGVATLTELAPKVSSIKDKKLNHLILPGINERVDGLWYYLPEQEKLDEIRKLF